MASPAPMAPRLQRAPGPRGERPRHRGHGACDPRRGPLAGPRPEPRDAVRGGGPVPEGRGPPPRDAGPPGLRGSGLPPGRRPEDPRGAGVHRPGGAARAAPGRWRDQGRHRANRRGGGRGHPRVRVGDLPGPRGGGTAGGPGGRGGGGGGGRGHPRVRVGDLPGPRGGEPAGDPGGRGEGGGGAPVGSALEGRLIAALAFDGPPMARNPAVWYVLYGIVIPLIVLGLSIYFNAGTILVFIGVVLWMGFALTMLSPPSAAGAGR